MNISRNILFLATLRLSMAASFFLLAFRLFATGMDGYFFLLWNFFLAAIPYALSIFFERVMARTPAISLRTVALFSLWLFFFPNAPYIATDFIHLSWGFPTTLHFAYDFLLIGMFTFSGLLLGVASLFRVQRSLRKILGTFVTNAVVVFVVFLSGVGMYLGRFLRWNSWDMFLNPLEVLRGTFTHYGDPAWFLRALFLSLIFSLFIGISYAISVSAYRFLGEQESRNS